MNLYTIVKDAIKRGFTHLVYPEVKVSLTDIRKYRNTRNWYYNGARSQPEGRAEIMKLDNAGNVLGYAYLVKES